MKSYLQLIIAALLFSFVSCTKEAEQTNISDAGLSSMICGDEELVLTRTTHTEEGEWKIKMNSVAAKANAAGLTEYPANAMIVKEKLDGDGKVLRYAVMFRAPGDPNAVDGWLWSEYDAEKHVIYSAAERAMNCQNCHGTVGSTMQ